MTDQEKRKMLSERMVALAIAFEHVGQDNMHDLLKKMTETLELMKTWDK